MTFVFIPLTFAVIEFGWYFLRSEITQRAVTNLSISLQQNNKLTATDLDNLVGTYGTGLIKFSQSSGVDTGNYICVDAVDPGTPSPTAPCTATVYNLTPASPPHVAGTPFNFVVRSSLAKGSLTNLIPQLNNVQVTANSGSVSTAFSPPECSGAGKALQFTAGTWSCTNPIPACGDGNKMRFDTSNQSWDCVAFVATGDIDPTNCTTTTVGATDGYKTATCPAGYPVLQTLSVIPYDMQNNATTTLSVDWNQAGYIRNSADKYVFSTTLGGPSTSLTDTLGYSSRVISCPSGFVVSSAIHQPQGWNYGGQCAPLSQSVQMTCCAMKINVQ